MSSANVQPGQVFVYSFDGVSLASNLYGTGVYTTDSNLAAAIIHSGALRLGERGLVKVTILPGLTQYTGSTQNGVTSSSYGAWRSSFKVERYHPIDEDDSKEDSAPPE